MEIRVLRYFLAVAREGNITLSLIHIWLVIGDDGYPTNEYVQDDGTVVRGSFDLVPLLEDFIREHPDFSYKGARARCV